MGFLIVPNSPPCIDGNLKELRNERERFYRFSFTKCMRDMLRSVSKKAIRCSK